MEKKFNHSLVLGKFYPIHKGHLYLIDTSISNSTQVTVIVCFNKNQNISGERRISTLKRIYNNENINIIGLADDDLPQSDLEYSSKDEFYSLWTPLVHSLAPNLDAVFTSEEYGDDFAHYLGIEHYLVDKDRIQYPISGTKLRNDPISNWKFIPEEDKDIHIKKICFLGPESVGKTTMSKNMSKLFGGGFVPEYGRTLYEKNGNIELNDFTKISIGRQAIEDWVGSQSNLFLFLDTEDIITLSFMMMMYPETFTNYEEYFNEKIPSTKYDLIILLKPDCPEIQDGTRIFLNSRWDHYNLIKRLLDKFNKKYIEVGGDWENREKISIDLIKKQFIYNEC